MYSFYANIICWPKRRIPKILLIMRLTTIIMITAILQVSAKTFAQKVTLSQDRITIKEVFKEVKKQTGYDVFYLPDMLKSDKVITVNFKQASLEEVMQTVLQGTSLTFTVDEKTIVVKKKEEPVPRKNSNLVSPPKSISGRVIGTTAELLSGATVTLKHAKISTLTDAKG